MILKNVKFIFDLMIDKTLTLELKILTFRDVKIHRLEIKKRDLEIENRIKVEKLRKRLDKKVDKINKKIWKEIKLREIKEDRL